MNHKEAVDRRAVELSFFYFEGEARRRFDIHGIPVSLRYFHILKYKWMMLLSKL
jgi:hypothetical protein